jgi:hypothetical protein
VKEAVLMPGLVKEEAYDIAASIDVVGFCRSAVGNVKELEVERRSLCVKLQEDENQQGDRQEFLEHDLSFRGKSIWYLVLGTWYLVLSES